MAKLPRMDTSLPNEAASNTLPASLPNAAASNTLPASRVIAAALLCGLLSFGCFYSTGLGIASSSVQASSTAAPDGAPSVLASSHER